MLRQVAARLSRSAGLRSISSSSPVLQEAVKNESIEEFQKKFKEVAPSTLNPPSFASDFLKEEAKPKEAGTPEKLTLNLYLPHEAVMHRAQVDLALIPSQNGDFGVMPGHVPTIAELRPGVLQVHTVLDKEVQKYFVSSGFAFVHADSTADVTAIEAVKLEELDPEAVRAGLQEYTAKLAALQGKADDYEIAAAQIGVEVYSALGAALGV